MLKLFLFIIVALAIYFLWLHIQKLKKQTKNSFTATSKPMEKCHYCNVYALREESVKGKDGQWYCCSTHAQKMEK